MATLALQVTAGADDARNINGNGTFNANNTTYRLGNDAGTLVWVGWRFLNVTIAQGSTINSATLDLFSTQTGQGTTANIIFYGDDSDTCAAWANTTAGKPEGRTQTTANYAPSVSVATFNTATGFGNVLFDMTSIVQEIVSRAGWASGNALGIVAGDNGSADSNNIAFSNFENAAARAAKLTIDYTAGGGGTAVKDIICVGIIPFAR